MRSYKVLHIHKTISKFGVAKINTTEETLETKCFIVLDCF